MGAGISPRPASRNFGGRGVLLKHSLKASASFCGYEMSVCVSYVSAQKFRATFTSLERSEVNVATSRGVREGSRDGGKGEGPSERNLVVIVNQVETISSNNPDLCRTLPGEGVES